MRWRGARPGSHGLRSSFRGQTGDGRVSFECISKEGSNAAIDPSWRETRFVPERFLHHSVCCGSQRGCGVLSPQRSSQLSSPSKPECGCVGKWSGSLRFLAQSQAPLLPAPSLWSRPCPSRALSLLMSPKEEEGREEGAAHSQMGTGSWARGGEAVRTQRSPPGHGDT